MAVTPLTFSTTECLTEGKGKYRIRDFVFGVLSQKEKIENNETNSVLQMENRSFLRQRFPGAGGRISSL